MNELEKEYEEYTLPDDIEKNLPDATFLELNIEDIQVELAKSSKKVYREMIKNNAVHKVSNLIGHLIGTTTEEVALEKDASLIVELLTHIADTGEMLEEIKKAITNQNYTSLVKLVDFLVEKYIENFNNLQSRRKAVEKSITGITLIDYSTKDTREEVKTFVRKKLNEFTGDKHLEKKN